MTEEEKKFEEYGGKPYGTIKCPFWTDGKTLKDKDVNVHHPSTCTKCWNRYDYNCYYPNNFKCDQYNEMVKTIKPKYLKAIVDIIRRDTNFVISSECKNDCNHGILKCPIHKACKHYDDFDQDVCNNGAGIPRLYSEYENCINYKKPEPTVEICSCVGNEMCSICSKKVEEGGDNFKIYNAYAEMNERIEKLENQQEVNLSDTIVECGKINKELSELKNTFDCHFRADKDYDLHYSKQIEELREQVLNSEEHQQEHELVHDIKDVLREFNEALLGKNIIGVSFYRDMKDKLGGEKTVAVMNRAAERNGDMTSISTNSKPPSSIQNALYRCDIPDCNKYADYSHKNGWKFCQEHSKNPSEQNGVKRIE